MKFINNCGHKYIPDNFFTFDDIMLVPQYSTIKSRKDCKLTAWGGKMSADNPIIPANMDTISGVEMLTAMDKIGGQGILHRFWKNDDEYLEKILTVCANIKQCNIIFSVGIGDNQPLDWIKKVEDSIPENYTMGICIDVAHGDSKEVYKKIGEIRQLYKISTIIGGNIATIDAARRMVDAGVDAVKVGIGSGSVCQTKIVTGHGVPQAVSIYKIAQELRKNDEKIGLIADGGIRNSGDIVKALALGADFVMCGSLLAGTEETPGKTVTTSTGQLVKEYRGQASRNFMEAAGKPLRTSEGIATYIPVRGPVKDVIEDLCGGIRSGMSYSNAHFLGELRRNAIFSMVTSASQHESHPHIMNTNGVVFNGN